MKRYLLLLLPLALAACSQSSSPNHVPASAATTPATTVADNASTSATASSVATASSTTAAVAGTTSHGADLLGRYHWQLVSATDSHGHHIDALHTNTNSNASKPLQIDFHDGRLIVGHTCNHMSASYHVGDGNLVVGSMAQTMKACPNNKLAAMDKAASQLLHGKLTMKLSSLASQPRLALIDAGGDTLVFTGHPTAQTRFGSQGTTVFMEVAAQTVPCKHPPGTAKRCLKVRQRRFDAQGLEVGKPGPWHPLEQPIEGYTHTPGVRNVLRLKRFSQRNAPAGATSTAYVLDMVVESESAH